MARLPLLIAAVAATAGAVRYPSFDTWAAMHGRTYAVAAEKDRRRAIYNANLIKIAVHNVGNHTWTMAVNKFADLTADEFGAKYIGGGWHSHSQSHVSASQQRRSTAIPASVNWVTAGAVTPVKNQGDCGGCWAFSTTGAVEGAWFISNGTLVSLSEQQLIDCSTAEGNQGCNGGLMDDAFQYIINNDGITTEAAYPYVATGPNACKAKGKPIAATISSFTDVTTSSDAALMAAIAQQPVSVAVEADQNSFQFYSSGVMTAACGTNLDHGVLAVGYGAMSGQDYYYVKNSWGADWGAQGYIYLGRGSSYNGGQGQCGILLAPSYPVVGSGEMMPVAANATGLGCDICSTAVSLALSIGCEGLAGALAALCGPFIEVCEAAAEIACAACDAACNEDCWAQKACSDVGGICPDPGNCF